MTDQARRSSLRDGIVRLGLKGSGDRLISRTGCGQSWLIDLRRVFLDRQLLQDITLAFWRHFEAREAFQVGGMETAAIPLLTAIYMNQSKRDPINAFIIRKERKTTGLGNSIEGELTNNPVVLVDDILNSASSAEKARVIVESAGRSVREMFVVIDYESKKGLAWRKAHGIRVTSLFTLRDFSLSLGKDPPPYQQQYRPLWHCSVQGGNPFYIVPKSAPVLVGDTIYRGCDAACMHAFDARTGKLIWEFNVRGASIRKGIWSTPAVHAGRVYFGAYNGTMYCLDSATGREIWSQDYGEWIGASPLVVPRHNMLYIGLEFERPWAKGSLTALDLKTGLKVWEHGVGKYQHGSAAYVEGSDLVVWGSADHETLAFNAKSGEIVWRFPTRRSVKYAPAVDEKRGLVAFASFDHYIYVVHAETGALFGQWKTEGICYTTPLFAGGKLFCGSSDRKLYVIDLKQSSVIKTIDVGSKIYSSPLMYGSRVVFGTCGGRVYEVDLDRLEIVGLLQLPDAITNMVVNSSDGKRLFVSTYMNDLFAFERL